jgi:hypothetical protein
MKWNAKIFGLCAGVLALMLASQVSAAGRGKQGPRASLRSWTACALDFDTAELVITTTLTNISSGNTVPETRDGGEIRATYKRTDERGKNFREFPEIFPILAGVHIPDQEVFEARFTLCDAGEPRQEVQDARELNGKSTVQYGIAGGAGETRMVMNRCTDDPDTEDVNEGGIYVADFFYDIEAACAALTP